MYLFKIFRSYYPKRLFKPLLFILFILSSFIHYAYVQKTVTRTLEDKIILLAVLILLAGINLSTGIAIIRRYKFKIDKVFATGFILLFLVMGLSRLGYELLSASPLLFAIHARIRFFILSPLFIPLFSFICFAYQKFRLSENSPTSASSGKEMQQD